MRLFTPIGFFSIGRCAEHLRVIRPVGRDLTAAPSAVAATAGTQFGNALFPRKCPIATDILHEYQANGPFGILKYEKRSYAAL